MATYPELLARVDTWFRGVLAAHPTKMQCRQGCFDCCLGLFDISIADVQLLQEGLAALAEPVRRGIEERSRALMEKVIAREPGLKGKATLESLDDDDIDALTDAVGPERCACLGEQGECLVYDHRPIVCRLNGAPVVDVSGVTVHPEGCFKNSITPREVPRFAFEAIQKEERQHLRKLAKAGFRGIDNPYASMFIPMAVLAAPP